MDSLESIASLILSGGQALGSAVLDANGFIGKTYIGGKVLDAGATVVQGVGNLALSGIGYAGSAALSGAGYAGSAALSGAGYLGGKALDAGSAVLSETGKLVNAFIPADLDEEKLMSFQQRAHERELHSKRSFFEKMKHNMFGREDKVWLREHYRKIAEAQKNMPIIIDPSTGKMGVQNNSKSLFSFLDYFKTGDDDYDDGHIFGFGKKKPKNKINKTLNKAKEDPVIANHKFYR